MPDTIDSFQDDLFPKRLKGVFSSLAAPGDSQAEAAPSGGDDQAPAKSYWFVKQVDDHSFNAQLLDEYHLPTGLSRLIDRETLMRDFTLEPGLGYRLLTQRVLRGDSYRNQGLHVEAKIEYMQVLRVDEENIRANFGLGLAYLGLNQLEKARYALSTLVKLDESFDAEHKHLFNAFGIALRKKGLFAEALSFYGRARQLCADDEHLVLNIARAWFEKGDTEKAFQELKNCLEINSGFREGLAFLAYMRKKNIHPQDGDLRDWFDTLALKNSEFGRLMDDA